MTFSARTLGHWEHADWAGPRHDVNSYSWSGYTGLVGTVGTGPASAARRWTHHRRVNAGYSRAISPVQPGPMEVRGLRDADDRPARGELARRRLAGRVGVRALVVRRGRHRGLADLVAVAARDAAESATARPLPRLRLRLPRHARGVPRVWCSSREVFDMKRRLFTTLSDLSLLLFVAVVVLGGAELLGNRLLRTRETSSQRPGTDRQPQPPRQLATRHHPIQRSRVHAST
jgi:hypothetical protein